MSHAIVRPRYTDGHLESPQLLGDIFVERVLGDGAKLLIQGRRGSGLTTALGYLAGIAREVGREVAFLDLSTTPLAIDRHRLPRLRERVPMAIAGTELASLVGSFAPDDDLECVELVPWTDDDLLELLGTPPYIADRARLHALLAKVTQRELLTLPRTARWLVDAALTLAPDEPPTLSRLYAAFLDTLPPAALDYLKARAETRTPTIADDALEDVARLLDATPPRGRSFRTMLPEDFVTTPLALPGVDHFLRAGACIRSIASGEVPLGIPPRDGLPFVAEMLTPALKETLRASDRTGPAATILWAAGETPPLGPDRALPGALLDRLDARGLDLARCNFTGASLRGASFVGACLEGAFLGNIEGAGACFDEARLDGARFVLSELTRARFADASAREAVWDVARLEGACFLGADLRLGQFHATHLEGAELSFAKLMKTSFRNARLEEADLSGADLTDARLHMLDLETVRLSGATLVLAGFQRCALAEVELDGLDASRSTFIHCDLSATTFRESNLREVGIEECWAHGAAFDGADLRDARFHGVNFHAGSSRAGLLIDKPPLTGNKTGYYLEGTTDDAWSSPDSLAVASFRGADLRGARFKDTDLFRVDFRGAVLDDEVRAQAVIAGAIVDDR